jgi:hypothetical protein
MLLRCMPRVMAAPALMATGLMLASGVVATAALGAGLAGAALLAKRMREERRGWRESDAPPAEPAVNPG